jgi:hypothetical protein
MFFCDLFRLVRGVGCEWLENLSLICCARIITTGWKELLENGFAKGEGMLLKNWVTSNFSTKPNREPNIELQTLNIELNSQRL